MNTVIEKCFKKLKIEYYGVLDYSDCKESSPSIMAREHFKPESAIVFLVPYYVDKPENISVYAASRDYHIVIRELCDSLIDCLRAEYPDASFHGYGDHSPIYEVGAALSLGLGILGDNGLIINEKYGSYVFVADVITDISAKELGAVSPLPVQRCLHCGACKKSCPTGILSGNSTDCLSAITQKKGMLSEDEIALIRRYGTVWGCDLCQLSCPYNRDPQSTPIAFLYEERISKLTKETLHSLSDEEFSRRAFAWRGRKVVERNLDFFS